MRKLRHGEIDLNWKGHEVRSRKALVRAKCRNRTPAEEAVAMKNAEKNYRRDRKREAARLAKTVSLEDLSGTAFQPFVEKNREMEVLEEIEAALWRLTPAQRRVVMEIATKEVSYMEAATKLGISIETVKDHLKEARKRLPIPSFQVKSPRF